MKIGKQERRDAKQFLRGCLVEGILDEGRVRRTVQALIAQKPRRYLAVLEHFQRLVQLEIARRQVRVESAVALPDSLQQSVRDNLARLYGRGLQVEFHLQPALLGGLRVQVGSDVLDGSIQARLTGLQESF